MTSAESTQDAAADCMTPPSPPPPTHSPTHPHLHLCVLWSIVWLHDTLQHLSHKLHNIVFSSLGVQTAAEEAGCGFFELHTCGEEDVDVETEGATLTTTQREERWGWS